MMCIVFKIIVTCAMLAQINLCHAMADGHLPTMDQCGHRNLEGIGSIKIGDDGNSSDSLFGEFPWMTAVLRIERDGENELKVYTCGGSLIEPSVVLTAAHSVVDKEPKTLKVRVGEWDTQTKEEIFPHQERAVLEIVIHPEYNKASLFNDVALLILAEPVKLAENVQTICLPMSNTAFDESQCFVTGWGKDRSGREGKYQPIMKRLNVATVPHDTCQQQFRNTRLGSHFKLHPSFICANGKTGRDSCKGDGGSPLVCPVVGAPGRYSQLGIVSWGIGCGDEAPGAYAKVPMFYDWINAKIQEHKFSSKYYTL